MNSNNPLVRWIVRRIVKKNKNCIIIINGATGSGKTYAAMDLAITLANELNTTFSIVDNMDFNFTELLRKTQLPQNSRPGSIFLFEEVGVMGAGSASREWQSKANKFFFSFMQTARHRNQIFIMTCPLFSYLEKGTRSLVHLQITMNGINTQLAESYGKPFINQTNVITGKLYLKYLRFKDQGSKQKLKKVVFNLPAKEIVDEYEEMKSNYTDKLNKKMLEVQVRVPVNKMEITPEKIKMLQQKGLVNQEIADFFDVNKKTIYNKLQLPIIVNKINQNP